MSHRLATDPLSFTIEPRALVYAPRTRKVARFDPPRLVAACPMPDCEWFATAPDSPAGATLAVVGRRQHAVTVHPEAVMAGGLVLAPAPYRADELAEGVTVIRDGLEHHVGGDLHDVMRSAVHEAGAAHGLTVTDLP